MVQDKECGGCAGRSSLSEAKAWSRCHLPLQLIQPPPWEPRQPGTRSVSPRLWQQCKARSLQR